MMRFENREMTPEEMIRRQGYEDAIAAAAARVCEVLEDFEPGLQGEILKAVRRERNLRLLACQDQKQAEFLASMR